MSFRWGDVLVEKRTLTVRINVSKLGFTAPGDAGRHDESAAERGGGGDVLPEDEEAEEAGPDGLRGVEQRRLRARQALQRRRFYHSCERHYQEGGIGNRGSRGHAADGCGGSTLDTYCQTVLWMARNAEDESGRRVR